MKEYIIAIVPIAISVVALVVSIVSLQHQVPHVKLLICKYWVHYMRFDEIKNTALRVNEGNAIERFLQAKGNYYMLWHGQFSNKLFYKEEWTHPNSKDTPDDVSERDPPPVAIIKHKIINPSSSPITISSICLEQKNRKYPMIDMLSGVSLPIEISPYGMIAIEAIFPASEGFRIPMRYWHRSKLLKCLSWLNVGTNKLSIESSLGIKKIKIPRRWWNKKL